eukprot:5538977-Amphidinium_carterae.3
MKRLEELLWQQLEERDGKMIETEDYIRAFEERDEAKMKIVCYNFFKALRALQHQWRKQQVETDLKKNELYMQKAERRKREQETQEAAANRSLQQYYRWVLQQQQQQQQQQLQNQQDQREHRRYHRVNSTWKTLYKEKAQGDRQDGEHPYDAIKTNTQSETTTRQQQFPRERQQKVRPLLQEDHTT